MKERNLYNDEFERQLKSKADQFKMYPSDKVWNEVHSSLHTRKRRFVIGMSFLVGAILFIAATQLISPVHNAGTKSVASKINPGIKAFPSNSLPDFTSGNLASSEFNTSPERQKSDNNGRLGSTTLMLPPVNEIGK